jgi:myosin-5
MSLISITAAVLHLGQIEFTSDDSEGCRINSDDGVSTRAFLAVASLLGLDPQALERVLTIRIISTKTETFEKKLTAAQAQNARDAIAKSLYGKIFTWIVDKINSSIWVDPALVRANIGVLDIFGFECFVQNSFEQLAINYTNESLQQQFNQFIFKMEQLEYEKEKIEWSFIEFPDNKDCLDLIEHKSTGILAILDDQCKLHKPNDERFAGALYKAFEKNPRFSANAMQKRDLSFCVNHYAGPVVYSTFTFVDKNKDELPKEAESLFLSSKLSVIPEAFRPPESSSSFSSPSRPGPATVRRGSVYYQSEKGNSSEGSRSTGSTSVGKAYIIHYLFLIFNQLF